MRWKPITKQYWIGQSRTFQILRKKTVKKYNEGSKSYVICTTYKKILYTEKQYQQEGRLFAPLWRQAPRTLLVFIITAGFCLFVCLW